MFVKFETAVVVEGKSYEAGAVVPASEVPAGCLEALRRQSRVSVAEAQTPLRTDPAPMLQAAKPEVKPKHK